MFDEFCEEDPTPRSSKRFNPQIPKGPDPQTLQPEALNLQPPSPNSALSLNRRPRRNAWLALWRLFFEVSLASLLTWHCPKGHGSTVE